MHVIDLPMLPGLSNGLSRGISRRLVTWRLNRVLADLDMERPVVLTTLPHITWLMRDVPRRGLIYYCTDDYSHWPSADREALMRADRETGDAANLVLAVSHALFDRHGHTGRCHYFPHGVDFAHFASTRRLHDLEDAVSRLPRPRIGFFGLIYEQLDFELLSAVARRFPEGSLVMIGPVAYCPDEFRNLENVHLLGKAAYDDLPRHIAGLDVLLLPYRDDEMIRQSSPLKLRECLASGKPTVSIDLPEVRKLQPHVRVASDRSEFPDEVRRALEESPDSDAVVERQRAVEEDGWDRRAEWLGEILDGFGAVDRASPALMSGGRYDA
jgi:glycosyltransferase involved in cell wall biosynthesis